MVAGRARASRRWRYAFLTGLLTSASALPALAATATATSDAAAPAASAVQEVIVTATKREENLQSVAVSVQALTPRVLEQHQVLQLDDYVKLLPSVSFQSFGPGQSQLYFRGISSGGDGLHIGSEPATGVYVDEMPLTTIGNGVDLHVYDIARVEALAGPQGTLFGASSLSGTLRIITNQPDPSHFSAAFDVEGNTYTAGSAGGVAEGYVNVPLNDKVAIRLVAFVEHDGGYIDNVLKSRTFDLDPGSDPATGDTLTETNARFVKNDFNDVDTYGGRAALKIDLNDSWTITPGVIYQYQKADGNFLNNPALGDLRVADFSPDLNVDQWYQASLTIQGKIADWDVTYAGGFFGRTVNNKQDYSYYSVAYDGFGYTSLVTFPDGHGGFLDPDQQYTALDKYSKESNEFRVASPSSAPLRFLGGIFQERQTDLTTSNFLVAGLLNTPEGPDDTVPGAGDDIFYKHLNRVDRDFAVFGELAYDIRPNLTLTLGGRYFTVDNGLVGFSGFNKDATNPAVCVPSTVITEVPCVDVNAEVKENGETHKVNLSWKVDPDRMVYFTYSTGFRPGGVNRLALAAPYNPDTISNFEVGWKTTWLDGKLRINGALFDEEWHGVQYALSPPGDAGVTLIFNAGNARSYGLEGDILWRPIEPLTLSASGTVLNAFLTTTFINVTSSGEEIAPAGTKLPVQPNWKVNASARYEYTVRDFKGFLEGDVSAQGPSNSALFTDQEALLGPTSSFATFDLSTGISKDSWSLEFFAKNLFDSRGVLSVNVDCAVSICAPYPLNYDTKPRLVGIKLSDKL